MVKLIARLGVVAAVVTAGWGLASPAAAAQVPCGNPTDTKVYLASMGGTPLCFAKFGVNAFNKVGVYRIDSGNYNVTVKIGSLTVKIANNSTRMFGPVVNPQFINLSPPVPSA